MTTDTRLGRLGKSYPAEQNHEASHNLKINTAQSGGGSVVQYNTLSTPVFVALLIALFIAATMSAVSIGIAMNASEIAQLAERNAKLAQYQLELAAKKLNVDLTETEK